jgi:hypothetical protein
MEAFAAFIRERSDDQWPAIQHAVKLVDCISASPEPPSLAMRTGAQSSAVTCRRLMDRSAATATDRASLGSFLFTSPACRTAPARPAWAATRR